MKWAHHLQKSRHLCIAGAFASLMVPIAVSSAAEPLSLETSLPAVSAPALADMSLEDLMNIQVTSVSKRAQNISEAPAAITVITSEDIRRSGLQSISELLRLAPGMNVARMNSGIYAISTRGFNDRFSNKLLVLMDGRQIYNPVFSGVIWEAQDYLLPDLDRIEVIRGPGATLWGANAVNGVINITSKSARDTQGMLVDARGSNLESYLGLRYGGKIDDQTHYRIWGKFSKVENTDFPSREENHDRLKSTFGGIRLDRELDDRNTLTFQVNGSHVEHDANETYPIPSSLTEVSGEETRRYSGGNVLGRWTHVDSDQSELSLQFYYEHFSGGAHGLEERQDNFDLDFQHRFALGNRQSVTWGAGYRHVISSSNDDGTVILDPQDKQDYRISLFVQDDIELVPDRLHAALGTKVEYNSYTGFEFQPSARLLYTPDERQTFWGAVSRAVRTPNRIERDGLIGLARIPSPGPGQPATIIDMVGNSEIDSENLTAFELGYRAKPTDQLTIDIAGFFNRYDDLIVARSGAPQFIPGAPPVVFIPQNQVNATEAESYGVEVAANLKVTENWRIAASYSYLQIEAHRDGSVTDSARELAIEGSSPRNQFQLHSYLDLTRHLELNASAYYVEQLPAIDVPSYVRLDVALTWRPSQNLDLTIGVQNLCDDGHIEFSGDNNGELVSEVPRTFYGQLTWRY